MKKRWYATMFGVLTLGLCLVSVQALAHDFDLTNQAEPTIYGACGNAAAFSVGTGSVRTFSCSGQLVVSVWNDDGTALDTVGSHPFGCASGQVETVTVNAVDPYSTTTSCSAL